MNTFVPPSPCQNRIEMAVRARARAILRRLFAGPQMARLTADEYAWLRQHLPEVITDSSLERALRLAGPDFDRVAGRYVSHFYEPDDFNVRIAVQAILAAENVEDIRQ